MNDSTAVIGIESVIHLIRERRVMLSTDLARLYRVVPKALVQAVKRNRERFPEDFMFRLTLEEARALGKENTALGWGSYGKYPPYAFTEHGVAMLSSVLKSRKAVRINVAIIRVFVRLRGALSFQQEVIRKLSEFQGRLYGHEDQLKALAEAIEKLKTVPDESPKQIGFRVPVADT